MRPAGPASMHDCAHGTPRAALCTATTRHVREHPCVPEAPLSLRLSALPFPCPCIPTLPSPTAPSSSQIMQHVMLLGMAFALIPTSILLLLNDDWALGPESDSLLRIMKQQQRRKLPGARQVVTGGGGGGGGGLPLLRPLLLGGGDVEAGGTLGWGLHLELGPSVLLASVWAEDWAQC